MVQIAKALVGTVLQKKGRNIGISRAMDRQQSTMMAVLVCSLLRHCNVARAGTAGFRPSANTTIATTTTRKLLIGIPQMQYDLTTIELVSA